MLFNLSADACGIGTFCTDGFPEAENSAMQHIRDCAILDLHKLVCPKKLEVFMATRTICFPISGYPYCREQPVTFTWIKGSKRQNRYVNLKRQDKQRADRLFEEATNDAKERYERYKKMAGK